MTRRWQGERAQAVRLSATGARHQPFGRLGQEKRPPGGLVRAASCGRALATYILVGSRGIPGDGTAASRRLSLVAHGGSGVSRRTRAQTVASGRTRGVYLAWANHPPTPIHACTLTHTHTPTPTHGTVRQGEPGQRQDGKQAPVPPLVHAVENLHSEIQPRKPAPAMRGIV